VIPLLLMLATAPLSTVRAEPVEVRDQSATPATRPSTSSGRTAEGMTPIDAERAFAAEAKTLGQWTAFRKWSTDNAVMFTPQPVNAHGFLKDRKDPPKAIDWWPTASYISCDGSVAVNTGGWRRPDGSVGYFSTVWQQQKDGGWKWIVDGGDQLKVARVKVASIAIERAACSKSTAHDSVYTNISRSAHSSDGTLTWAYQVSPDGSRQFSAAVWDGRQFIRVIDDKIPAPLK
jgi:hypothetical protein